MTEEDDPLYLSDEERAKLLEYQETFNGVQALRLVLGGGERYRRYVEAEQKAKLQGSIERRQDIVEQREVLGDEREAAAMEEEMRQGREFHQRLYGVSPPPEDQAEQ